MTKRDERVSERESSCMRVCVRVRLRVRVRMYAHARARVHLRAFECICVSLIAGVGVRVKYVIYKMYITSHVIMVSFVPFESCLI